MKSRQVLTATVYDRKGKVLAVGYNNYDKTHPLQAKHAIKVGQPERIYLHAEIAAITKAVKRGTPYKIHVERLGKDGKELLAQPCPVCMSAIVGCGIKVVSYTL